jgi:hypothetical protein
MKTLGRRLKAREFQGDATHGFVIDRLRDDLLEARYVERVEYTETITDPFGKELSFERVEFRQSHFRATAYGSGLEIRDPPRSVQPLMNRLSEATDFAVTISLYSVDVLAWAARFQTASGFSCHVDLLRMSDLQLEEGVMAKVVLKGDRDVREACTKLAAHRRYLLDRIQLRLDVPKAGTVVLSHTGAATLSVDKADEELLEHLRSSLP